MCKTVASLDLQRHVEAEIITEEVVAIERFLLLRRQVGRRY